MGGPTAILEYDGLRWLTDPTLSPPGEYGGLTKLTGPALDISQQDEIDVVLVSHHQHTDNLDPGGRAFLPSANRVASTTKAAEELGGNVVGMEPWSEVELETPRGRAVKVTAVRAQHGPDGSDEIQGPVLGFVLSAAGAGRIYVSGDNASRDVVRAIVHRTGELPIAILNAGAVQLPKFDRAYLTLSADHAADVAKILGARTVIPLHSKAGPMSPSEPTSSRQRCRATGSLIACSCSSALTTPRSDADRPRRPRRTPHPAPHSRAGKRDSRPRLRPHGRSTSHPSYPQDGRRYQHVERTHGRQRRRTRPNPKADPSRPYGARRPVRQSQVTWQHRCRREPRGPTTRPPYASAWPDISSQRTFGQSGASRTWNGDPSGTSAGRSHPARLGCSAPAAAVHEAAAQVEPYPRGQRRSGVSRGLSASSTPRHPRASAPRRRCAY